MFPDTVNPTRSQTRPETWEDLERGDEAYHQLEKEFVGETRSQLATLTGEIANRNRTIQENDAYVYGDLLSRSLKVPVGHDFTPVNWLRRTVEIHKNQMMGKGFNITSAYHESDTSLIQDDNELQQANFENTKRKFYAEQRRVLLESILRDNSGFSLFARLAENASAVGDSVLKAWYDGAGKYHLEMVEATEHIYAIWSSDNFRAYDAIAYVHQVSRQIAVRDYGVPETVATSPLGMPLAVLASANTIQYVSTQPMVTVMEVTGRIQGWCAQGKGTNARISRCQIGDEEPLNVSIVGDHVKLLIADPKFLPHYYILPNKLVRRRPWGLPDISKAAINLNQTYIETLSDWRTKASRVNFPKFLGYGFGPGTQVPKPKPRTVEVMPVAPGQDIKELTIAGPTASNDDFQKQIAEIKEEFVREVGISQVMFDNPEIEMVSKQAMQTSMGSISDLVDGKRQLWGPILSRIMEDAVHTLALWDDGIKELDSEDNWYIRVSFPSSLGVEDPVYQQMLINRLQTNTISLQTFLEKQGETKEELDRIRSEMQDKDLIIIHGKQMGLKAELAITPPPSAMPPKVAVNLRGDLSPDQEANLAAMHGFNNGPVFGPTAGPQGELGMHAMDDYVNQGMITGDPYKAGQPVQQAMGGGPAPNPAIGPVAQGSGPGVGPQPGASGQQQPDLISATPAQNMPGSSPMSVTGSPMPTPTSAQGAINKRVSRKR